MSFFVCEFNQVQKIIFGLEKKKKKNLSWLAIHHRSILKNKQLASLRTGVEAGIQCGYKVWQKQVDYIECFNLSPSMFVMPI